MSNAANDDEQNLDLIHPEIVNESEPWPPQRPFVWSPSGWPSSPPPPAQPPKPNWRLHILLFVATCLCTFAAGFGVPRHDLPLLSTMIWNGLCYSVPVMTILLCHEMGHFVQAKRYGVYASLPYFIPMPFPPLGTLGAVIMLKSQIKSRRALFDIGITGPLAGLVPTIIFLLVGLHYSSFEAKAAADAASTAEPTFSYGSPLLLDFLVEHIRQGRGIQASADIMLHPMAFAGWVGLLVTSLNLIPIGQLDGGHVLYALLLKKSHKIATFLLFAAFFLTLIYWKTCGSWILMLTLLMFMGPRHPPTADDEEPLGTFRTVLGWLTLAFILVGFTPTPLVFSS